MKAALSRFPLPTRTGAVTLLAALALAACSSSNGTDQPTPTPTVSATATPTVAATASPTESASASASESTNTVPTAYDPCELVTAAEASTLSGASFAAGTKSDTSGGGQICNYSAAGIVVEVLVGQSTDTETAVAQEPAFKAQLENGVAQAGVVNPILTEIPEFETGVDAAVLEGHATVQGVLVSAIALYALKGPTFLAISEVTIGGNPATSDEIQTQAHTSLGRISF